MHVLDTSELFWNKYRRMRRVNIRSGKRNIRQAGLCLSSPVEMKSKHRVMVMLWSRSERQPQLPAPAGLGTGYLNLLGWRSKQAGTSPAVKNFKGSLRWKKAFEDLPCALGWVWGGCEASDKCLITGQLCTSSICVVLAEEENFSDLRARHSAGADSQGKGDHKRASCN